MMLVRIHSYAGTAESLQKYVFDEETAKHSLELMNLIACTTFLFEQQLVKAWIDDKDAEALRCQKLLVEEEEAAQKRQAALLERKKQKKLRKKQKKLRQKEQKTKDELLVRKKQKKLQKKQKKLRQKEQKTKDELNECKEYLNISINGNKAWTKKFKVDNDDENSKPKLQKETSNHTEQNSFKVMIGSIPVSLRDPNEVRDTCSTEHAIPKKSDILEKQVKRSAHKPWIPVNRHETIDIWPVDKGDEESEGSVLDEAGDQSCMQSCSIDSDKQDGGKQRDMYSDGNAKQGRLAICSIAAKESLAQRWKEAVSSNRVKLDLSPELEPPLCSGTEDNCTVAAQTSVFHECNVNGNTETEIEMATGRVRGGDANPRPRPVGDLPSPSPSPPRPRLIGDGMGRERGGRGCT